MANGWSKWTVHNGRPDELEVKSDDVDAVRAARRALAGIGVSEPRCRGEGEAIRVLLATRAQAIEFRTRAIAALHALVVSAPDSLRDRLRRQLLVLQQW
jgi:transposase